jgi:hypothetical protein
MITKSNLLSGSARFKNSPFVDIRRDKFSNLPNQVFMWIKSTEEPFQNALFRVLLAPRTISDSFRVQIKLDE